MNLIINNSKLRKADSMLVFAIGILVCILVAFFKESIFPEKYFNDTITIQRLIKHPYKDLGDSAFTNTAKFFRIFHIDKYFLAPVLAIISYFLVIYFSFKKYSVEAISLSNFFLIVSYSAMAMVYMSTYSKDLVLFLFVIVPFVFFEKKYILIWTLFAIFYAAFFRDYWFVTILLFWGLKIFIIKKPKFLILTIPLFYFLISCVYNYIFGVSLSMIRYITNIDRDADSAQTAIKNYVDGNNFLLEAVNFIITLVFLIIPIPLLLLAKPFYVILTLLIVVFFYNFIKLYVKEYKNEKFTNIFSFVISFILVQSLFEPDYGSFVRHLAPLYPIIFVCIAKNTKFLKIEED
jgi:hypothetical protein